MTDRPSKLRKLNKLRMSCPHLSASALHELCSEIERSGLPELHRRDQILEAAEAEIERDTYQHAYGRVLRYMTVQTQRDRRRSMRLLVAHPVAFLSVIALQVGVFSEYLRLCIESNPSSYEQPWDIVLYADEVVPGNPLGHNNDRKTWVLYWTFLQLGLDVLQHEEAWFTLCLLRSSVVAMVAAGISQVIGECLKLFFSPSGNAEDLSIAGMILEFADGSRHRLFARFKFFVQDGLAHKCVFGCKGDNGSKLCMLCKNLYAEASELTDEDGTDMLTCSIINAADLRFATNDDIRGAMRRLEAAKAAGADDFDLLQQAVGFTLNPNNILLDRELDRIVYPADCMMHDWMHLIFVQGIFNTCIMHLLHEIHQSGVTDIWDMFHGYVCMWTWPRRVQNKALLCAFDSKSKTSSSKAKHFKCKASEGLSLYPVVALFVQLQVKAAGICIDACNAFLALCDIIDLLGVVALQLATPEQLAKAIDDFLNLAVIAGWRRKMHPKFHWLVHLPIHLRKHKCLLSCFVHERKHRVAKRFCEDVKNTIAYERSVLVQVLAFHMVQLQDSTVFMLDAGLVSPQRAPAKLASFIQDYFETNSPVYTSDKAKLSSFASCQQRDVVLIQDPVDGFIAGEVYFLCRVDGFDLSYIELWALVGKDGDAGVAEWSIPANPSRTFVLLEDILCSVTYLKHRPGFVKTLLPIQFRNR